MKWFDERLDNGFKGVYAKIDEVMIEHKTSPCPNAVAVTELVTTHISNNHKGLTPKQICIIVGGIIGFVVAVIEVTIHIVK
jgi:hypothetical protein